MTSASGDPLLEVVVDLARPAWRIRAAPGWRARPSVTCAPSLVSAQYCRARHAAVQDVADDGDLQPFKRSLLLADGEGVQQALGRVFVGAVAGVDDRRVAARSAKGGGARRAGVAHHHDSPACIAWIVRAVSISVSPFATLLVAMLKLTTSALRRLAAISKRCGCGWSSRKRGCRRSCRAAPAPS